MASESDVPAVVGAKRAAVPVLRVEPSPGPPIPNVPILDPDPDRMRGLAMLKALLP
jgi:hypothetical protein